ncbi:MAG: ACT domain-containing protein [Syntrophobacteraceae bacterium]
MEYVEQISVFMENKVGRLAEVTRILAEANINIRALSLADTSDFGILRLILNDNHKAKEELKKVGFAVATTQVAAVEVSDQPGGLHHILSLLQKANVNVEYIYAFIQLSSANAVLIFRFDNLDEALRILKDNNVRVIEGEKLYAM